LSDVGEPLLESALDIDLFGGTFGRVIDVTMGHDGNWNAALAGIQSLTLRPIGHRQSCAIAFNYSRRVHPIC
jgi:hypothetical protein